MKLFLDTKARRFVKSAASNVALQTLHLKRRDQVPIEIIFVANNAVVTAPTGTATTVGLKAKFSDANFLAFAAPGTNTLNLNTEPVEAAFSSNPASLPALLEVRWSAPGEALRTATLQVELQNSVILGDEGTPAVIPDLKATQAEAEAGTSNEKWITPLRAWDAIRAWAVANFSWANLAGKPTSFPPSSHTHTASQITDFSAAVVAAAPPTTDASLLTSGTLADTRLSATVTASLAKADTASQPGHGHSISDVANLATALAEKATVNSVNEVNQALTTEASTRAAADTALDQRIDFLTANLDPAALDSIAEAAASINSLQQQVQSTISSIAGTSYKPVPLDHTITANYPAGGDALFGGYARATDWNINFSVSRTVDFYFNNNPNNVTGVTNFPILGDCVNVTLSGSATLWTANFKRPNGSILLTVTSADSDLKKSNLRFIYDGTAWILDRTVWNPDLQSALDGKQPTGNYVTRDHVQSGGSSYFERSGDAASQNIGQGQSVHQLVLANDTRLTDARRVQWFPAPPNFYTIPNGATAGAMAYDGSYLYLLVPYGPTALRWARSPMTTTW